MKFMLFTYRDPSVQLTAGSPSKWGEVTSRARSRQVPGSLRRCWLWNRCSERSACGAAAEPGVGQGRFPRLNTEQPYNLHHADGTLDDVYRPAHAALTGTHREEHGLEIAGLDERQAVELDDPPDVRALEDVFAEPGRALRSPDHPPAEASTLRRAGRPSGSSCRGTGASPDPQVSTLIQPSAGS